MPESNTDHRIAEICAITGLCFCGPECGCGENSGLLFTTLDMAGGLPDWMNGSSPEEVDCWLQSEAGRRFSQAAEAAEKEE